MRLDFAAWVGRPVVLQIRFANSRLRLYGRLLRESEQGLRLRVAECLDLDVPTEWIEGVAADSAAEQRDEIFETGGLHDRE